MILNQLLNQILSSLGSMIFQFLSFTVWRCTQENPSSWLKELFLAPFSSTPDLWDSYTSTRQSMQERDEFSLGGCTPAWRHRCSSPSLSVQDSPPPLSILTLTSLSFSHPNDLSNFLVFCYFYCCCYTKSRTFIFIYGCLSLWLGDLMWSMLISISIYWAFTKSQIVSLYINNPMRQVLL